MISKLHKYRFELFLLSQAVILFGSLVFPSGFYQKIVYPIFLLTNIAAGFVLVSKREGNSKLFSGFFLLISLLVILSFFQAAFDSSSTFVRLGSFFVFYALVSFEIIKQVWRAKVINKNVILGLISGYVSLGLLAFFLCMSIELIHPNSFSGLSPAGGIVFKEQLLYYAYITLMTIGYGDILPISPVAQKGAIFIGLLGQFYLVILTAIVVGKYINQTKD